jgi:hypothetical protein
MKKLLTLAVSLVFIFGLLSPAYSHGGGLDGQGGHNCRKGACVRTIVINLEDLFARKLWELNRKLPRTNSFWFFRITVLPN